MKGDAVLAITVDICPGIYRSEQIARPMLALAVLTGCWVMSGKHLNIGPMFSLEEATAAIEFQRVQP